jgi:hypothetical protein
MKVTLQNPPTNTSTSTVKKVAMVLGILIGGAGAVCVVAIVALKYWVNKHIPDVREDYRVMTREARDFGRMHVQNDCIAEGLRRNAACNQDDLRCLAAPKIFVTLCLRASVASPGVCEAVPRTTDPRSAQWRVDRCVGVGHSSSERCERLMSGIQVYCENPTPLPPG